MLFNHYLNIIEKTINKSSSNISTLIPFFIKNNKHINTLTKLFLNNLFSFTFNCLDVCDTNIFQNYITYNNNNLYTHIKSYDTKFHKHIKYDVIITDKNDVHTYSALLNKDFIVISTKELDIKYTNKKFDINDINIYLVEKYNKPIIKILFAGWIYIPHSYAIVMCNQIINMYKYFSNKVEIYFDEVTYAGSNWIKEGLFYGDDNKIFDNIKKYNNEKVDIIYKVAFPYNITSNNDIPTCVFFTAELLQKNVLEYFIINNNTMTSIDDIYNYSINNKIFYTTPSLFSYNQSIFKNKFINCDVISHGVDTNILCPDTLENIKNYRTKLKIKDNEIILLNISSLTLNKGLVYLLFIMNNIVNVFNRNDIKLFIKMSSSLYNCRTNPVISSILESFGLTENEKINLYKYIVTIDRSLDIHDIKKIYLACDIYISPYILEGFNLPPLEALSCGKDIIISETGSTKQYIDDIMKNGDGNNFIKTIKCSVNPETNQNIISNTELHNVIQYLLHYKKNDKNKTKVYGYIKENYDWKIITEKLLYYLYKNIE